MILEVVTYPFGAIIGGMIVDHRQPVVFVPAIRQQGVEAWLGGGGKFAVAEQDNVDIRLAHAWLCGVKYIDYIELFGLYTPYQTLWPLLSNMFHS